MKLRTFDAADPKRNYLVPKIRRPEVTPSRPEAGTVIPASAILQELHDAAPAAFSLGWLMGSLPKQSFGLVMLLLAILAAVPGISLVAGLVLMIAAVQMIAGRPAPVFPRWIATRSLPTRHLGAVVQRAIAVLRYLETTIHPRWPMPPEATKRVVGIAVMLLDARLLLNPLPLSNVIPGLVIALISLAYLEEDGLILLIGLLAGFVMLALDLAVLGAIVFGAKPIGPFW